MRYFLRTCTKITLVYQPILCNIRKSTSNLRYNDYNFWKITSNLRYNASQKLQFSTYLYQIHNSISTYTLQISEKYIKFTL